ncbi:hypothetical protein CANCADRAFT_86108 [Tortispora caseinolytica NRRL Y-17796]|uniref:Tr-type G domain-containing protein n=1 Tax=Tortispora caseinolytica NRRL Y-17796 TaxID=767744 RepID=A0A1E4TKW9_9ASCO|nr:hypothetical protein CANCADRAFT_86108 [Tortispora caseinolytica NRRL Y-17796]
MNDEYDEFGNLIEAGSSSESASTSLNEQSDDDMDQNDQQEQAVVLHEDKQYYPDSREVFGANVQVLHKTEDTRNIDEPIVNPKVHNNFNLEESQLPETYYSKKFLIDNLPFSEWSRTIAVVGDFRSGKTSVIDSLVYQTHDLPLFIGKRQDEQLRYTDIHQYERDRGLTINANPIILLLPNSKGKSHLVNFIDTPGHPDFYDQTTCAMELCDGIMLVIDVITGLQPSTYPIIRLAARRNLPVVLVMNKLDRLITELRIPPSDAYEKLKYLVDSVNEIIQSFYTNAPILSPQAGNVVFASAKYHWSFSLNQYASSYPIEVDTEFLSERLWGDISYDPQAKKFVPFNGVLPRTFTRFVLEPVYKLFIAVISETPSRLQTVLESLNIIIPPAQLKLDAKPLLKIVCSEYFGESTGLVDALADSVAPLSKVIKERTERLFQGPAKSKLTESIIHLNSQGPLVVHVTRVCLDNTSIFLALGRVFSGEVTRGMKVRLISEDMTELDLEDTVDYSVEELFLPGSRYKIPLDRAGPGCLVLLGGSFVSTINKSCTIISSDWDDEIFGFKPLEFINEPLVKVSVEPVNLSELPKMIEGLRDLNKTFPSLQTRVEESGEHILLGSGELYMDCVLYSLRKIHARIDIKVSDPATRFAETVLDTSALQCYAISPNGQNKLTMIAEPLEPVIVNDIENHVIDSSWTSKALAKHFQEQYGWDILAARSIWAFGPGTCGPNLLQDDTLEIDGVNKKLLETCREYIQQGFQWATLEGPLVEEPMRNVRFKLTNAEISDNALSRNGGQIIPTSRRVAYISFLMATPALLEPIYSGHINGPEDMELPLRKIINKRRGMIIHKRPIPGTQLYYFNVHIPVIDSFGFEIDVRIATQGQASVLLVFEKWDIVPGDPLDKNSIVGDLEVAEGTDLARDFMLKTRKRKGLSVEPNIAKYLDEEVLEAFKELGITS